MRWLLNREDGTYRVTMVSELGRVADKGALIELARNIARAQVKSREAVAYIRRERRNLEQRPDRSASAAAFALALLAAAEDYRRRHPDLTHAQVSEGLRKVYFALAQDR